MKAAPWFLIATIVSTFALRAANVQPMSSSPPDSGTTIAVLIRGADASANYLANDYARILVHLLAGVEHLTVVPRSRMLQPEKSNVAAAEVGRAVAARHVLSAIVRLADDTLEISAELIDAATGINRWRDTYRCSLGLSLDVSAKMGRAIVGALNFSTIKRNPRESEVVTRNADAWKHYLQGRRAMETLTEPSLFEAIAHLERARDADPEFIPAHVALASAHIVVGYNFRNPRLHFQKARQSLANIPSLAAPLVEAGIADAVLSYYHDWNWLAAVRGASFATQHDLAGVETHACFLHCAQTLGRIEEGLQQITLAHRTHPDSSAIRTELSCAAYYAGRFAEAERESRNAISSDPENPLLHWGLARTLAQQGRFDAALVALEMAQSKPGGDWSGILSEIAYVHGRQNRSADAQVVIAQLRLREKSEYVDHYLYAMAFAGLGDFPEVFRHLERAAADRSTWIPSLPLDPKFVGIRADSRYATLLRTLDLGVLRAPVAD